MRFHIAYSHPLPHDYERGAPQETRSVGKRW